MSEDRAVLTWRHQVTDNYGQSVVSDYTGFMRFHTAIPHNDLLVVVCWEAGEASWWIVDGKEGLDELHRYYREHWWSTDEVLRFRIFVQQKLHTQTVNSLILRAEKAENELAELKRSLKRPAQK